MTDNTKWRRVSHREPCPICQHPDWCTIAADGTAACCMRVESERPMKNGGYLHRLDGVTVRRPAPAPIRPAVAAGTTLAPIEQRDAVYRTLLTELGLSDAHRRHLIETRGLPVETLAHFATLPEQHSVHDRCRLAARVTKLSGCSVKGVPGLYVDRGRPALVKAAGGILVSVPDEQGRIQALQIRADHPGAGESRYVWLSSAKWAGGTSSGSPVAVWRPELAAGGVWLSEGSLKGYIASLRLPSCVVAVAGVAGWRAALPVLSALATKRVVIAYDLDSDPSTRAQVESHREALALALCRVGLNVSIASWDTAHKGVDDALLAGAPITVADWRRRVQPICRAHGVSIPPLPRPAGLPLPTLTRPAGVPLTTVARGA